MNLDEMTTIEIRNEMTKLGWSSEDRMSEDGWSSHGYSLWFYRWNWHGMNLGSRASFGAHQACPTPLDVDVMTRAAAKVALEAWDKFTNPGEPPFQDVYGHLRPMPEYLARTVREARSRIA